MGASDTEQHTEMTEIEKKSAEEKSPEEKSPEEKSPEEKSPEGCCVKTLRVVGIILLAPVALVVALVAVLVWILLLPLKCICPCCSPCLTLITEALLAAAKGLCRLFGFACNKGDVSDEEKNAVTEDKKSDYGSTTEESKK